LGGTRDVTQQQVRAKALEYRQLAFQGNNPKYNAEKEIPSFEVVARQVHADRKSTWRNPKHADQFINTLRDYAFPHIGGMPVSDIGQPEVLACLMPIWATKHETATRVAQRIKTILDFAEAKGFREGKNPVTSVKDAKVLPKVRKKVKHHAAMRWQDIPSFYAELCERNAMSANSLRFTCLAASRTNEVLSMQWAEIDEAQALWVCPAERMKTGLEHYVPLSDEMLSIIEPLKAMKSKFVFEGQRRHKPMSNMSMLMLLRRMGVDGATVHGFRSTFRDWASEKAKARFEAAELSLAHKVGNEVSRAYDRTSLLDERRGLMGQWAEFVTSKKAQKW